MTVSYGGLLGIVGSELRVVRLCSDLVLKLVCGLS